MQFRWDRYGKADENSSMFLRLAQSWAGNKWGAQILPRVGMEVVVEFLEGDPDRPQRHRRAGQLENRDQRWYLPPSA